MKNHTMSQPSFAKKLIRVVMRPTMIAVEISTMKEDIAAMNAVMHIEPMAALRAKACHHGTIAPEVCPGQRPGGHARHLLQSSCFPFAGCDCSTSCHFRLYSYPYYTRYSWRPVPAHKDRPFLIRETATPRYIHRGKGEHFRQKTPLL